MRSSHKVRECIKRRTTLSPHEIGSRDKSYIKGAFKKDGIPFSENLKETFKFFETGFIAEVKEMKDIFEQMEDEVDQCSVAKKSFKSEKKQLLINNDRLLEENIASDIMCTYLRSLNEVDNCGKCKSLDIVLLDIQESNKSLKQMILNNPDTKNKQLLVKTIDNQSVEINYLKVQVQDKLHKIEDENVSLAFQVSSLVKEREHIKLEYKKLYDSIKQTQAKMKLQTDSLQQKLNDQISKNNKLRAQLKGKFSESQMNHNGTSVNTKELLVYVSASCPFTQSRNEKTITKEHAVKQNTRKTDNTMLPSIRRVSSTNASGSKLRSNKKNDRISQLSSRSMKNKVEAYHRKFKSSANKNNHVSDCNTNVKNAIMGYRDLQMGNILISRAYYVEGLGHNLFSIWQFCDLDLEVAFRKHTCFVRNLEGVDLLSGSRGSNIYTISMADMMKSSPICLLSKAL
ncbi:hypothetical protein Tco_1304321 [Tanacetum coccineum]